jgi:hypothetical protein
MATNSKPQTKLSPISENSLLKVVWKETSTFIERLTPEWLDRCISAVSRFFRNLRRAAAYAKFGWSNHEFDNSYLLALLHFKLQRMHTYLKAETYAKQDKLSLQSLRLATRLAKKLTNENYSHFLDQHDKKWGPLDMELTPAEPVEGLPGGGSVCKFTRPNVTSKRKEAQERREFKKAVEMDEQIRARDARWLFSIMEKYYQYWWD